MKKNLFLIFLLCALTVILCFPKLALEGSTTGLLLWFHTVLPTLLPFIILTNLLLKTNVVNHLIKKIYPFFHTLFKISPYGCYAMICGFLCGYPMGAKITADLLKEKHITKEEAQYLLGFCNNVSPAFFLNYVAYQTLDAKKSGLLLLLFLYAVPLLYAFFIPRPNYALTKNDSVPEKKTVTISFRMVDESIMDGFETITRLGGYIILFAIIAKMATAFVHTVAILDTLLIGFVELTNGILTLQKANLPFSVSLPCASFLCTFGGLSGIAQTKSMIQGTTLSIRQYVKVRFILSLLSVISALLFLLLFKY